MIAFGVVFVLLLGEIDLSVAYVSGIAAVAVARAPAVLASRARLPAVDRDPARPRDRRRTSAIGLKGRSWRSRRAVVRRHAGRPPHLAGRHPQGPRRRATRSSSRTTGSTTPRPTTSSATRAGSSLRDHQRRVRAGGARGAVFRGRHEQVVRTGPVPWRCQARRSWPSRASARWRSCNHAKCRPHARRARLSPRLLRAARPAAAGLLMASSSSG